MKSANSVRWNAIRAHQFDEPNAARPFSLRLAQENNWTPQHAERVIEEYRRFAYLCATSGQEVTPSVDVDEVWHLHIAYTRNYLGPFAQAMGRILHHGPSSGGDAADEHYRERYEATLALYTQTFGHPPPSDIWPSADVRFSPEGQYVKLSPDMVRIMRAEVQNLERSASGTAGIVGFAFFLFSIFAFVSLTLSAPGWLMTMTVLVLTTMIVVSVGIQNVDRARLSRRMTSGSIPMHLAAPLAFVLVQPFVPRKPTEGSSGSSCSTGLGVVGDGGGCGGGCGGGGGCS